MLGTPKNGGAEIIRSQIGGHLRPLGENLSYLSEQEPQQQQQLLAFVDLRRRR